MYDNEEEIKKKRRNLLIGIGVVVGLILLLLLLIVVGSSGGDGGDTKQNKEIKCELEVTKGTLGSDGTYVSEVTVEFKSIQKISEEYAIKKSIGTSDNARNKETYTITKSGTYPLNGYVQDEMGNKGTCSLTVKVSLSEPTCELEITEGTEGEDGWYTSDVEVAFKTMSSNSESSKIVKYYMEEEAVSLDDEEEEITRADIQNESSRLVRDFKEGTKEQSLREQEQEQK